MSPEQISRLKEVLLTARAIPEAERSAWIDAACGDDEALHREALSLLTGQGWTAEALRTGAIPAAIAGLLDGAPTGSSMALPERVGPYRILGLLGEGGMGIVYRAQQEHPVRRDVALKVSRDVMGSAEARTRFESERQALALMDHPHIARLLDAGSTEEGRPYFVMELVRGISLTDYCRQERIPARGRVEIFLKAVHAVRHAHQNGIVHRDLKPSNILVALSGDEPTPKVIDFSVAKALGDPLGGNADLTRTGQVVGTLHTMAPEQALGKSRQIDARTDVYALGVILYVLLAERFPIDVSGAPLHEAIRRISQDPPAPMRTSSTRWGTTSAGGQKVDADLETITFKCLEKEPARRYASAAELADDLERYLTSRPILARPASRLYQMRKLVRRHPVMFGSIAAGFVVLIGFSATVTWQLEVQKAERARAELQARKAERISAFHLGILEQADPGRAGGRVSIREALNRAAENVGAGLREDPEVVVEIHRVLGDAFEGLGMWPEASAQYLAGLALRRTILGDGSVPDLPSARLLAGLAMSQQHAGDLRDALRTAKFAASMAFAVEGPDSPVAVLALRTLAWSAGDLGRMDEAREAAERCVAISRKVLPKGDPGLVRCLKVLGWARRDEEGERYTREALEIQRAATGEESSEYLDVLNSLAGLLGTLGKNRQEYFEIMWKYLAGAERIYGVDSHIYALAANNLGVGLLESPKDLAESQRLFDAAHAIWSRDGETAQNALSALGNASYARCSRGDYLGCAAGYEKALELKRAAGYDSDATAALFHRNLGMALHLMGEDRRAEESLRRGLEMLWSMDGPDALWGVNPEMWLACLLLESGRADEAIQHLRHVQSVKGGEDTDDGFRGRLANLTGRALAAQGRREEAEPEIEKSRTLLLDKQGSPLVLRHALEKTAEVYDSWGRRDDAAACHANLERLNALTSGTAPTAAAPAATVAAGS